MEADYKNWKKRTMTFLKYKCNLIVKRTKLSNKTQDTWDELDIKAINYISSVITSK